jgi:multidrug efflux system outer membrane protein
MWQRGRQSAFSPQGGRTGAIYDVHASVSWELDLWGRLRRLNEAARAQYLGAQEQRRGVYLATVAQVAQAYFELRELDARLDIARSTTAAFQETHDLFKRRLTGGTASALETTRAEAALASASAFIPNLERQIQAQENLLCFLVGRSPGPVGRGADLAQQTLPPRIPAGLPSTLLERRPDLRATEQDLVAANAAVGVAKASYFPTLSLTGLFGGLAPQVTELFGSGKTWLIAPGLAGPALQGLRLKHQKDVRIAQWEQAKTRYEAAVTSAFGEVSTALSAHAKLAEVEQRQARAVAAYQEAVRLATLRYAAGLSSYVEVLDAQQQLFPAQNTLSQVRLSRLLAVVQLYKALGGGWKLEDPRRIETKSSK